jgi:hypothetical protein
MLAAVDLGLLAFTFTGAIAASWAWSLKQTTERIAVLEAKVAELQRTAASPSPGGSALG